MKITRRDLFKYGVAGTALVGMERAFDFNAKAMELIEGGREVSRTTGKFLKAIPSTCLNCYARCGNFGFVANGELIKIGPNTDHPNSRGRMCAKGQAGLNLVYDPDRIVYPMKRIGPRGEGRWKRISWEEAYQEIATRIRALKDEGRAHEFVFQSDRDITTQAITRRFCHALGSPNALVNHPVGGWNKRVAQQLTWGADFEVPDVANTQYMLVFGSNPFEAHYLRTSFVQRIAEARGLRQEGNVLKPRAKMVVFDVRLTQTSGKADEWHPVRPGTDAAVALGIAKVILDDGLEDARFIREWTNVSRSQLAAHLQAYTPERVEAISGVPAGEIRRIARDYATTKPATTISTGGVSKHQNGVQAERAVALLNAITGNVDVRGGYCMPRAFTFAEPDPVPQVPARKSELLHPKDLPLAMYESPHQVLPMVRERKEKVSLYMTYQHNPVYSHPDGESVAKILRDDQLVPFHVCIDAFYTETARYADLILPSAVYAERWELESPPSFEMVPFVSLRQPLIRPRGEAVALTDVLITLAQYVGGGMEKYFNFTTREYLTAQLRSIPKLVDRGGLHYLKERGFWFDQDAAPDYGAYRKHGFPTPSGKFEIYSERLEKAGFNPLPTYEPLTAAGDLTDEELHLVVYQWSVHTHDRTGNCMWLSEIVHENPAFLNAETAARLGLSDGDDIVVASKVGEIKTKVKVVQGIHPKVVAIGDSVGHSEFGRIARAEAFDSNVKTTKLLWWHGHGSNAKPIVANASDPIGGGQGWMDTKVWIKKV